jgi:hypothetical protein
MVAIALVIHGPDHRPSTSGKPTGGCVSMADRPDGPRPQPTRD